MEQETVHWNIRVSKKKDLAVRNFLKNFNCSRNDGVIADRAIEEPVKVLVYRLYPRT